MGTVATDKLTTGLASQGGHWYKPDGTAVYEIPTADGKRMRSVTLADARKLNLYPGVTGVLRVAAAPGLEAWKIQQVLLAAATLPDIPGEQPDAWIQRVKEDAEAQAQKAREKGIAIHTAIELMLGQRELTQGLGEVAPLAMPAVQWVQEAFYGWHIQAERSAAHRWGFGCRVDLAATANGGNGMRYAVADFKTTDKPLEEIKAYDDHRVQLAGNALALWGTFEGVDFYNCFVSTREPGVKIIQHRLDEIDKAAEKLKLLLALWKLDRNYYPGEEDA